jgi:hypothetical protein
MRFEWRQILLRVAFVVQAWEGNPVQCEVCSEETRDCNFLVAEGSLLLGFVV